MIKYSFNLMFHSDGSFEILAQKGDLTLDERSRFESLKKALTKICTPPKQLELISNNIRTEWQKTPQPCGTGMTGREEQAHSQGI
jgi:hypothetical protein